jgi:hypothetical protein
MRMPSDALDLATMHAADDGTVIDLQWQRLRFETQLLKLDGTAFEDLFQKFAVSRWPDTFTPTIPMGRRGDLKCDGFEATEGAVHQCWGPRQGQFNVDTILSKIEADYRGAYAHWGDKLKVWRFVHNTPHDALPSEAVRLLVDLSAKLGVPYMTWGRQRLLDQLANIASERRAMLFGKAPQQINVSRITFNGIGRVLAFIKQSQGLDVLRPIERSADFDRKIEHNALSRPTAHFLHLGQAGEYRVGEYLSRKVKPNEADDIVRAFKTRYEQLRSAGHLPDKIFAELVIFAGGVTGDMEIDASALAVVAHLFAKCEVFERPDVSATT